MAKPKKLTPVQSRAAVLVAEDRLTNAQIAAEVGTAERTLQRWKQIPAFEKAVDDYREAARKRILSRGVAVLANRVAVYDDITDRLRQVIDARARRYRNLRAVEAVAARIAAGDEDDEPGAGGDSAGGDSAGGGAQGVPEEAETGLVVLERTYGKMGVTEKWAVDTGTLAELRNIAKQAAQDLGQWQERTEVETRDSGAVESLKRRLAALDAAGGAKPVAGEPDADGGGGA